MNNDTNSGFAILYGHVYIARQTLYSRSFVIGRSPMIVIVPFDVVISNCRSLTSFRIPIERYFPTPSLSRSVISSNIRT